MSSDDPAAAALAEAHAGYHAETRRHRAPDTLVDDVVSWSAVSPHLVRARLFLVVPTVLLLIYLLLNYLESIAPPDPVNGLIVGVTGFATVVLYVLGVAAFFAPAKEPIAEHSRLVEGRAADAAAVGERVRQAARARRTPAEVTPSTVAGVPVLLFRQRSERAMLLVQPYGDDLYVGWTMWRSRSTVTLLAHFLRDTFGRFAPLPQFSAELRSAATRALRESVHSLAREGVASVEGGGEPSATTSGWSQQGHDEAPPATGGWNHRGHGEPEPHPVHRAGPPHDGRPYEGRPSGELPRSGPVVDPTGGWTRRRDEAPAEAPADRGWGPPPRERW